MPQVGQFQANSPAPYFDQIRAYANLLAGETAIPVAYLGYPADGNPASADAIRALESRLVKKAERRQKQFGRTWQEVARLALLIRDGEVPPEFSQVRPIWRDPATPTVAAADAAVKLITAGVLTPDSEVTYNRLGFTDTDKAQLARDKATSSAVSLVAQIANAANPPA